MSAATTFSLDAVLASDRVPSLPDVALRIIEIVQDPDPDLQVLIRTVRTDPAIAGRILKFANSALFGLRHRPTSIDAAVPLLGTTLVRTLALGFSLARQTPAAALQPWFRLLWRESLFQATAAEYLAEKTPSADPPTWFLAGLLQDVGQIALLNVAQAEYHNHVLDRGRSESRVELEAEHFGFTHVDVSVALCKKWNLESGMISAIQAHHDPVAAVGPDAGSSLATGLAAAACCSEYMDAIHERLATTRVEVERFLMGAYGCLPHEVQTLLAEMDVRAVELAGGFSIDVGDLPPRARILARAQSALREIALENRLRTLADPGPPDTSAHKEPPDRSEWAAWLDEDLSTCNRRYLDRALPQQLAKAHADGAVVGLLKVDFSAAAQSVTPGTTGNVGLPGPLDVIKESVRPTDSVVRTSPKTAIVILPGLNYDTLNGIAARIQDQLNERRDLPDHDAASVAVGGVVVVPAGRRIATSDLVLNTLDRSADKARDLSASRIAFQLLMGKRARPLTAG